MIISVLFYGLNSFLINCLKDQLNIYADRFNGVELDALRSSIEALDARLKRIEHSPQDNLLNQDGHISGRRKNYIPEDEISQLKSSIEKLSLLNNENTKRAKLIESALRNCEISSNQ